MVQLRRWLGAGGIVLLLTGLVGCRTFEVHQFDSAQTTKSFHFDRAAVIMATYKTLEGERTRQSNKLFTEQLIVSLQQRGIDVAERQKVEALLVDSDLVETGRADLTETERVKRLGRLLKVDLIIYGDAIANETYYTYFGGSRAVRAELERQANESGVVKRKAGYSVLAQHSIGLSIRAVDTATGGVVWVGYRALVAAREVDDRQPDTLTNFGVIQEVCDKMMDELVALGR
jgi:hypothetical protein